MAPLQRNAAGGAVPWLAPLTILALVALAGGLPLVLRCTMDGQINYNEGWNAYRQQAAGHWYPLYAAPPGTAITNYPPLSFHLVGLLGRLCGDVVLAGRLVSLLAIAVVGGVLYQIAGRLSGSRAAGACCGLCWLIGLEFWTPDRIGADDPQLLAMAMQALGLLAFLSRVPDQAARAGRRAASPSHLVASAALVSLGLFAKHNLLALPVGLTLFLVLCRHWRELAIWLLTGLACCSALLTLTVAVDGSLFLTHLLMPRAFLPVHGLRMTAVYTAVTSPALVAVARWSWRQRNSAGEVRALSLVWLASLLEIVLFAGGDGVANNIFQDAILTNALLHPVALWQSLSRRQEWPNRPLSGAGAESAVFALIPLLLLPLLLATILVPVWASWQAMSHRQDGVRQAVALLRERPGPVMCETLLLCFRAGRPSAFDAYYVQDQIRIGRLSEAQIDAMIEQQTLAAVQIGTVDDPASLDPAYQPRRFPASFMAVLHARYRLVLVTGDIAIFEPRAAPLPGAG